MDRLKREADLERGGSVDKTHKEHDNPESSEKTLAVDNKLLVAFWSCCQLER